MKNIGITNGKINPWKRPHISLAQTTTFFLIQGLELLLVFIPVLFGGPFSLTSLVTHFLLGMVIYLMVNYFQVKFPDLDAQKNMAMLQSVLTKVTDVIANNELKAIDKISLLERVLVWIIRELDYFYKEQLDKFTHYIRATLQCAKCEDPTNCDECDFFLTALPKSRILIKQRQEVLVKLKKEARKEVIADLKKEIEQKKKQLQKRGDIDVHG